jgi:ketosteroid isomerase-like protein
MKHAFAWPMALALTTAFLTTNLHAEGNKMTRDQTDVQNAIEAMTSAFQRGEIDQVMSQYEVEATVVFEPAAPMSDRDAITEMFTGMAAINPTFTYSGHEVIVNGDIAIHTAPWVMEGKMPDGQVIKQSGLSVAVLRKQADGKWLMVIDNPHGSRLLAAQ